MRNLNGHKEPYYTVGATISLHTNKKFERPVYGGPGALIFKAALPRAALMCC